MPAYIIFTRDEPPHDAAMMKEYQKANRANPPAAKAVPLVVYGKTEALEGDAPDGTVILKFDDIETARAWYYSDEYQASTAIRKKAANYRAYIIEGFEPPAQ